MMRLFKFIRSSFKKEFSDLIHKNKIIITNSVMLFAFVALIGLMYMSAYLDNVDTYILDLDQSSTSRVVVNQFAQSLDFNVEMADSYGEVREALRTGEKSAGLVIPDGFSKAIKSGKSDKNNEVLFMVDGTNYIVASSVYARGSKLLGTLNAGIAMNMLEAKGIVPKQAEKMVQSISLKPKYLNNPSMGYNTYLSYGILTAALFSLILSGLAIVIVRESKKNLINKETIQSKMIFYSVYIAVVSIILYVTLGLTFKLPLRGNFIYLILELIVFGLLIFMLAIVVAFLAKEDYRVFQISVFLATPMLFITGFTWNYESMPWMIQGLYYICPITPIVNAVRAILVNDCGILVAGKYFIWQIVLVGIYGLLAFYIYNNRKIEID